MIELYIGKMLCPLACSWVRLQLCIVQSWPSQTRTKCSGRSFSRPNKDKPWGNHNTKGWRKGHSEGTDEAQEHTHLCYVSLWIWQNGNIHLKQKTFAGQWAHRLISSSVGRKLQRVQQEYTERQNRTKWANEQRQERKLAKLRPRSEISSELNLTFCLLTFLCLKALTVINCH